MKPGVRSAKGIRLEQPQTRKSTSSSTCSRTRTRTRKNKKNAHVCITKSRTTPDQFWESKQCLSARSSALIIKSKRLLAACTRQRVPSPGSGMNQSSSNLPDGEMKTHKRDLGRTRKLCVDRGLKEKGRKVLQSSYKHFFMLHSLEDFLPDLARNADRNGLFHLKPRINHLPFLFSFQFSCLSANFTAFAMNRDHEPAASTCLQHSGIIMGRLSVYMSESYRYAQ